MSLWFVTARMAARSAASGWAPNWLTRASSMKLAYRAPTFWALALVGLAALVSMMARSWACEFSYRTSNGPKRALSAGIWVSRR